MNALINKQLIILFPIVFFACILVFSEDESITITEIGNAEKLIGLNFTSSERDSMLDDLNDNLKNYLKIRNVYLNNSIMPIDHRACRKKAPARYSPHKNPFTVIQPL